VRRLAAAKIGPGVPEGDVHGRVHSVFTRAAALALDGGALVTVVGRRAGGLPFGVTLEEDDIDFARSVREGMEAAARGGVLRIGTDGLAIDLRPAARWRSGLGDLRLDPAKAATARALDTARALLEKDGRHRDFAALGGAPIAGLMRAAERRDGGAAQDALARLVGLGAGGTPAGDDFIVGFLAALWAARGEDARSAAFLQALGGAVRALSGRTNDVSRAYLEAATEGEVSETLTRLVAAVAAGDARLAADAAAAAIAVGHTSGADGVFGFVSGAEAVG
jgi:hypothetical protein